MLLKFVKPLAIISNMIYQIISECKLDLESLYEQKITNWGKQWHIIIKRNSIMINIELPYYHNQGLGVLLTIFSGIIQKKAKINRQIISN